MRRPNWTPSIVPNGADQTVYLVVDDFGRKGRAYREADVEAADLETVIVDLFGGQYNNPIRVVAFNTAEGWSQDVSPKSCGAAATCKRSIRHQTFKILSSGTNGTTASSSRCGWCHHEQPPRGPILQIGSHRAGQREGSSAPFDRRRSGPRRIVHG
jgi:hypothetical protein